MSPTDLVVVLPGILGSTLRKNNHMVWAPSAGSAIWAIATLGQNIKQLQLPDGIGDEHPGDGVEPVGLMPDLHVLPGIWTPVKGYDVLLKRLRTLGYRKAVGDSPGVPPGNLVPFSYDWRLSCRYNAQRLAGTVEDALGRWRAQGGEYAEARVTFVCHSMGGLIARWYIEKCGGAEVTGKLITLGTPYRGAARSVDQLVNGAPRGIGPFSVDLSKFAVSLPSLHQLLPEYACISQGGGLAKVTEVTVPGLHTAMTADAMRFHRDLRDAEAARPQSLAGTHAIVGTGQPTATTVRLAGGLVELADTYQDDDLFGDSTVPLPAACRADVPMNSNILRRVPDKHGNLPRNRAALDEMEGVLTATDIVVRGGGSVPLCVSAPEFVLAGQPVRIGVRPGGPARQAVHVTVRDEAGRVAESHVVHPMRSDSVTLGGLTPGAYTVDVSGPSPTSGYAPVSSDFLVWDSAAPIGREARAGA